MPIANFKTVFFSNIDFLVSSSCQYDCFFTEGLTPAFHSEQLETSPLKMRKFAEITAKSYKPCLLIAESAMSIALSHVS